jgi:hypothetical protein
LKSFIECFSKTSETLDVTVLNGPTTPSEPKIFGIKHTKKIKIRLIMIFTIVKLFKYVKPPF